MSWGFAILILMMVVAFLVTAAILIFNRFYDYFHDNTYKAYNETIVRHLIDETEPLPIPDILRKKILRDVIIDLLFIMKGAGVLTLRRIYEANGLWEQDVADLRARAWHKRLAALVRLDRWQTDLPFSEMEALMEDENKTVLIHALKTLSLSTDEQIAKDVLNFLCKKPVDLAIRYECLSRLLRNHRTLVLTLLTLPDWRPLAAESIRVLGDKRDISSVPVIIDATVNGDDKIKECAFKALGKIGDPRGISLILDGFEASDPHVRLAAVQAMNNLDEDLLKQHKEMLLADSDPLVRAWTNHLTRAERT